MKTFREIVEATLRETQSNADTLYAIADELDRRIADERDAKDAAHMGMNMSQYRRVREASLKAGDD